LKDGAEKMQDQAPVRKLPAADVKAALSRQNEIAFLDVREHGQYGEGHPFFIVNCAYSVLEDRINAIVPNRAVPVVLMDDDDGVAMRAAKRLFDLGYRDVAIVERGVKGWTEAGFGLFKGVNLPSKAYGEFVEHDMGTPSISAEELHRMQSEGEELLIFDGRSPSEFTKMNIPGAQSVPNAELGLRLPAILPDSTTPVVINCAGRTRSIIGAQTLLNLGLPNPVVALRNGSQGWQLAGLKLEYGTEPDPLSDLSDADEARARAHAETFITANELPTVDGATLASWQADGTRTTYLFDVRSAEEYAAGHLSGSVHAPGGQLVQATDHWTGVRNAHLVVSDPLLIRAATTCFWLRRMGHDAHVLAAGAEVKLVPAATEVTVPAVPAIDVADLPGLCTDGALVLDLSPGQTFRAGHIDGARWAIRPRLNALDIKADRSVILTAANPRIAAFASLDLAEMGITDIRLLPYDPDGWRAAGLTVTATPDEPADEDMIDYLFFVHNRHDGCLEAARKYLEWETGLIEQMDEQEVGMFRRGPAAKMPLLWD
tara:strand:- start:1559 stop:3187 length:1629 start_codon:yes stop_codon:yes gene_type:complete